MTDPASDEPAKAEGSASDEATSRELSIRLDQFLKLTGMVGTGGQAKLVIQAGEVMVNGEIETRRRRQLHPGDVIVWGDDEFEVESA